MEFGYDLIEKAHKERKRRFQEQLEEQAQNTSRPALEPLVPASIDESARLTDIVYARDPSVLDSDNSIAVLDALKHENYLNIKYLIQKRDLQAAEDQSPNARAALRVLQQAQQPHVTSVSDLKKNLFSLASPDDKTLLFESRFECGNLYLASKINDQEYNLLMQNDINTLGHTQWFYFRVQNTTAGNTVKFTIINYAKPDSLFNYGMLVSVYSERKAKEEQVGWHKDCHNIKYFSNGVRKQPDNQYSPTYYSLTFSYKFSHDQDTVYFAYSTPYSYTDLRNDLNEIE
jgi:hypothetical protein